MPISKLRSSFDRLGFTSGCATLVTAAALAACGGVERPRSVAEPLSEGPPSRDLAETFASLPGRRVSEFTLLVFDANLSRAQWREVFLATSELARLRTDLSRSRSDTPTDAEADSAAAKTMRAGEILGDLVDRSTAYLFSWGESENCSVAADWTLRCKPRYDVYGPNPLNGGLPESIDAWRIDRRPEDRSDSLRITLRNQDEAHGKFTVELHLKPERVGDTVYFKGDAIVEPGSTFLKDGQPRPHFRYGYAELRF